MNEKWAFQILSGKDQITEASIFDLQAEQRLECCGCMMIDDPFQIDE